METFGFKVDSDVVKDEGKNRFSRDDDTLASGSGLVRCGTILGEVTATGKFKPLTPAASDGTETAAAIILQDADARTADVTVVNLKRRAQIVLQSLVWPAGITPSQRATALKQLSQRDLICRNGV